MQLTTYVTIKEKVTREFAFSPLEIASVIHDLGLSENAFGDENSERMKIVNCWDNCDIVACPGSGKTTVLLAKLLLLAHRMPFDDGRGVCVLTHTNVAIDEIKHRLGTKSDVLFRHPNFFGTIQAFVDRFFTIPCCAITHKIRPIINNDIYETTLSKRYEAPNFPKGWFNNRGGFEYFRKLRYNFNNISIISYGLHGEKFFGNSEKPTYVKTQDLKEEITQKGIICYEDAFSIANWCIIQYPRLLEIVPKRFARLFVDEMQDTQSHQMAIIEQVLSGDVIKQFYGDLDQAIFDGISGGKTAWNPGSKYKKLQITDTKRFGTSIANVVTPFCREIERICANEKQQSIKPYMILFENPKDVLPKFYSIIKKHHLEKEPWDKPNKPFNAVGFVGKESEDKLTLKHYFSDFNRNTQSKRMYFKTLISYLQKQPEDMEKNFGSKVYYDSFMNGLWQLLDTGNCKHPKTKRYYTVFSFKSYLKEKDEIVFYKLHKLFAELIVALKTGQKSPKEIKNVLLFFFKDNIDNEIITDFNERAYNSDFVTSDDIDKSEVISSKDNFYKKFDDDIEIQVGTVHSVKGKTNLATLFLETENYGKCESDYFFDSCGKLFCGDNYRRPKNYDRLESRLKTTYVALSRPTKLLCVALQKDKVSCTGCEKRNDQCDWEICDARN